MGISKKEKKEVFELIKQLFKRIAGKNAEPLASIFFEKKKINEFKLAEKMKMDINPIRNLLYKLFEHNVLSFIRKKEKKKGWYTYYWTLDIGKSLEALKKLKQQEIKSMLQLIKSREEKNYYFCPNNCMEVTIETAMLHDFLCPECGTLLQPSEKEKKLKEIENKIKTLEEEIKKIDDLIEKLSKKEKREKKKK